jgi:hypothetical protein
MDDIQNFVLNNFNNVKILPNDGIEFSFGGFYCFIKKGNEYDIYLRSHDENFSRKDKSHSFIMSFLSLLKQN